ncbi:putative serine/threonine-protein kinase [Quercus suber]|uniref:non-specific serine/threonine protein kinase n=1 Tax=Quercus suber TaxID=58331 RepID=A0AAW0KPQ6_QUESU
MFFDIVKRKLSHHTSFFNLPLWALILVIIAIFVVVLSGIIVCLYFICYLRRRKSYKAKFCMSNPIASKNHPYHSSSLSSLDRRLLSRNMYEIEMNNSDSRSGKGHPVLLSDPWSSQKRWTGSVKKCDVTDLEEVARYLPMAEDVWRGCRFSLKEIEMATNGLAKENVIGMGDNGIVYRGSVKKCDVTDLEEVARYLPMAEDVWRGCRFSLKEIEMATNGLAKENVIGMGDNGIVYRDIQTFDMSFLSIRMLVYEYVDNGNLYQWLHENPEEVSPLPWNIRMKIIQGIAKGYVAPECDSIDEFPEKTDVYSFGILVMEIISGWTPLDCRQCEPHLIEWLKSMVVNQKIDNVVDPKLSEIPCSKELKRIVLVALRCVDPDIKDRPNMGDVIHMLEPCDMILNNGSRIRRETSHGNYLEERVVAIADDDPDRTDQGESGSESLPNGS